MREMRERSLLSFAWTGPLTASEAATPAVAARTVRLEGTCAPSGGDPLKETSEKSPITGKFLPVKGVHSNRKGPPSALLEGGAPMTACCRPQYGGEGWSAFAASSEADAAPR
ncbi:hypothetical protein TUSST3_22740 [Streptomyces sp. TUS-ST3]|nr:hypothetical protein TUSST3_22740 [Streptomyces sp. TUS-ST3]